MNINLTRAISSQTETKQALNEGKKQEKTIGDLESRIEVPFPIIRTRMLTKQGLKCGVRAVQFLYYGSSSPSRQTSP